MALSSFGQCIILEKFDPKSKIHYLLATTAGTSPSVIRIRIKGLNAEMLAALLSEIMSKTRLLLAEGVAIRVPVGTMRFWKLPLSQ